MEKKRFRLYKKKSQWVVAPIIFFGVLGIIGLSSQEIAYADDSIEVPVSEIQAPLENETLITTETDNTEHESQSVSSENSIDKSEENKNPVVEDSPEIIESEKPTEETSTEETVVIDDEGLSNQNTEKTNQTDTSVSEEEVLDSEEELSTGKDEIVTGEIETSTSKKEQERASLDVTEKKDINTLAASSKTTDTKAKAAPQKNIAVYRIYNPGNGEHFYTTNLDEKNWLVRIGWGYYEGIAFQSPNEGKVVYRLYNKGLRDHHYTMSWDEVSWLTKNYGWTYEGVSWKSSDSNGKKVYRLFTPNQKTGSHLFTMSWDEVSWLTSKHGWKYEGVGFYSAGDSSSAVTSRVLNVPYVSQYAPVFSPWGCAGAAMTMLLRYKGANVDLKYVQDNLPMYPNDAGGQKGNVYTGAGFGWVITPQSLTNYAKRWYSNVSNITGSNTQALVNRILGGNPVLYYGFSSYQKQNDNIRNHCKVIVGFKDNKLLIHDPLYYTASAGAGSGGRNMAYDRGAIAWVSINDFNKEWDGRAIGIN